MASRCLVSLELDRASEGGPVSVAALELEEEYSAGWKGRAVLALAADLPLGIGEIFGAVLDRGILPGSSVTVRISLVDDDAAAEDSGRIVRTWPCVVARIEPEVPPPDGSRAECVIELEDPVRHRFPFPLRAVFAGCSIAEMTGGALGLAAGLDGTPSLEPVLPGAGSVTVVDATREALGSIPYAIASGESLGDWLDAIHSPLGVRRELRSLPGGGLEWTLTDRAPGGGHFVDATLDSSLGEEGSDATEVRLCAVHGRPGEARRGAVLDDIEESVLWRFDPSLPVGTLIEGTGVGPDEAWLRADLDYQRAFLELLAIEIGSRDPGLRPGTLMRIRGLELADIDRWQVTRVAHQVRGRTYANRAEVLRGDAAWRPPRAPAAPPRTLTATVAGEEDALPNEPVPRDPIGRIPVRIPFSTQAPDGTAAGAQSRIELPVVQPMAGALHGFAPVHRNGDACRLTVHHPFSAEIDGFVYRGAREVYDGDSLAAGWAGFIVEHDGGKAWSGWAFERAVDDAAEDSA